MLGIADQIFSSLTNFVATAIASRMLGSSFGELAVAMAIVLGATTSSRSLTSQVLSISYASDGRAKIQHQARQAISMVLAYGGFFSFLAGAASVFLSGSPARTALVLAFSIPLILLQDFWRFYHVLLKEEGRALILDLVWLCGSITLFGFTHQMFQVGPSIVLLCWAGTGALAGLMGFFSSKTWFFPSPQLAVRWSRNHIRPMAQLFADNGLLALYSLALVPTLAILGDIEGAGFLRIAQTAYGPAAIVVAGINMQALPVFARRAKQSRCLVMRLCFRLTIMLALLAGTAGVLLFLMPEPIIVEIFGSNWLKVRPVVLALVPWAVANASCTSVLTALRGVGEVDRIVKRRLILAPLQFFLGLSGAIWGGGVGAAIGLSIGSMVAAPVWWSALKSWNKQTDGSLAHLGKFSAAVTKHRSSSFTVSYSSSQGVSERTR